ncbi:MAG: hypothetical protein NTX61_03850 [Bacteroidetes bacterium]|nr:hypothetical protein [Bacteroidota bacterium]
MDTVVIKAKNKSEIKFWLELAKKTGNKAKAINTEELEDTALAVLIEKGMKTPDVSRDIVMKTLRK